MIAPRFIGTLAGAGFCVATISAVEMIGHRLLGAPADPAAATPAMMVLVLFAWTLGTAVGGSIGSGISKWRGTAWIVAALVTLGIVLNHLAVPTPLWFSALGIVLVLLIAWLIAARAPAGQRVAL